MLLFRELARITKQALGLENTFGFRTTLANQLYLMYIILGKMYWTEKLHRPIKFVYFIPNLAQLCNCVFLCTIYSISGVKNDLILLTQLAFLLMLMIYLTLIVPLASWAFGRGIETMIGQVDAMLIRRMMRKSQLSPRQEGAAGFIDIRTSLVKHFALFCLPMMVYMSAGTLDVALFYEEEKVKSYMYYTTPFPNIHESGSMLFLLLVNVGLASFVGFVAFFQLWSVIAMPLVWAALCHNEVVCICQDLRVGWSSSGVRAEDVKLAIVKAVRAYQKVSCIIGNFKGFYNVLSTITFVQLLATAIANAYVVLLWDIPYLIRIRGTSAVWLCTTMILQLCSVGETINNLTNLMSREIYSTPWHRSTKNRRDMQLFLCQAQTVFDLSAFKVYPFGLSTVLRFINLVYSSANFLRKVTRK